MSVKVRLSYPYRKLVGKEEVDLDLTGPAKVKEVLRLLAERHPSFKDYVGNASDEQMAAHMVILQQDRVLRLEDTIEGGQTIQIMAPVAGG